MASGGEIPATTTHWINICDGPRNRVREVAVVVPTTGDPSCACGTARSSRAPACSPHQCDQLNPRTRKPCNFSATLPSTKRESMRSRRLDMMYVATRHSPDLTHKLEELRLTQKLEVCGIANWGEVRRGQQPEGQKFMPNDSMAQMCTFPSNLVQAPRFIYTHNSVKDFLSFPPLENSSLVLECLRSPTLKTLSLPRRLSIRSLLRHRSAEPSVDLCVPPTRQFRKAGRRLNTIPQCNHRCGHPTMRGSGINGSLRGP